MTWDFHTLQGREQIAAFIKTSSKDSRIVNISLYEGDVAHKRPRVAAIGDLEVVQAFLQVETSSGRGEGLVNLIPDPTDDGKWKAFTLFTTLKELKGHEEKTYTRRPTFDSREANSGSMNWKDKLNAQQNFESGREPTVLILGRLCVAQTIPNTLS